MKVKNLFSSRNKSKKKKNSQQASSVNEVSSNNATDRLIISPDTKDGHIAGKENERSVVTNANSVEYYSKENVVLRSKVKKSVDNYSEAEETELTQSRGCSISSNSSTKAGSSRRPWSFIDQLRRQDSRESAYSSGSSARTSQLAEDFITSTSPPRDGALPQLRGDTPSHGNRNSCTLPRSLTPEQFEEASKSTPRQDSTKRRTMDFRFFNFFKRSSSGESSVHSDALSSASSPLVDSGRSSFRGKNKGKKKGSKKRREDSNIIKDSLEDSRRRSMSDGGETSAILTLDEEFQIPPPGLYDSAPRLNSVNEHPEPTPEKVLDRRVPVNGEPAFYLGEEETRPADRIPSTGSRKYTRRSDPTSAAAHSVLRMQMSEGSAVVRSSSDSADSSSRRSSFVCEPRNSPLPEDSIASFDSSAYLGARARKLYSAGSVPQIPQRCNNQKVERALSNEISKEPQAIGVQARCSQSVSNLASGSADQNSSFIPRSTSDVDKPRFHRRTPQPSPHQQKQEEHNFSRDSGTSGSSEFIAPPSPVLRAIGYPGVVLRRNRQKHKPRPNSAFADQRTQQVMSLNMEDLPTYSQMRCEMTKGGANAFPTLEDVLSLQENGHSTKCGSNGVRYANTASGRAKRRGATLSHCGQRTSVGFSTASVEDGLDSLSSSNFGSKQSLNDRLDDDEMLNAFLARSLAVTHTSSGNLRSQEPSSKRAKAIRKSVVSLANLISPGKPNQKGGKLQRSSSFKESGSAAPSTSTTAAAYSFKPYRPPCNTPNKTKNNRRSKLWCETFDHTGLNEGEIKWQEAIFELYQGERDLVQDLTMAKQTYRDSMVTLKMLSDEEVNLIFGKLGCLLPLHEQLLSKLEQARGEDGRTLAIGWIFVEWFPQISTAYREYCSNQADAKYALDAAVERDARVRDFLQRCLESPFSRKLDLWSYLDLPRTRLVKYPLLLQNVLKRTPTRLQEERDNLIRVVDIIGEIIEKVDETTGEQQCRYIMSKLDYLDEKQKSPFVDNSRLMLCSGQLKNNRGTKMHVFLFEEAFVLTRQTTRSNKISYQVYRHPLPLRTLVVDTNEGEKLSGSFRGGILSSEKVKHSFRVRSEELNVTYTLQASEEHDRKQWINAIQDALCKYKAKHPEALENQNQISRRRATYDTSSKKLDNSRSVLRSSSDKSNYSVASSSDKSSLQEESQEDDASTTSEDVGPWRRRRSQTANPSILTSKSAYSVSRKSSGSSTKSDDRSTDGKGSKKSNADAQKLKYRLKHLEGEADGPPSPLRDAPRKLSSISRHFSLTGADKPKIVSRTKSEETEKARNKCQRSRSLTSSPQTVKSVVARFGAKRLSHSKIGTNSLVAPTAAKPPIAPSASPFSVRRTPSMRTPCTIHEAQSTPNLAAAQSTSFCTRRSSTGISHLAPQNDSNSVGNLREGLTAVSASDLRIASIERTAEEAKSSRKARSENKPASEGDVQDGIFVIAASKVLGKSTASEKPLVTIQLGAPMADDCTGTGGASSEEDFENGEQENSTGEIENENLDIPAGDVLVNNAQTQDNKIIEIEKEDLTSVKVVPAGDVMVTDVVICLDSDADVSPNDATNRSLEDVTVEFCDRSSDENLPRPQSSCGDLISFASMEADEPVKENVESLESSIPEVQDSSATVDERKPMDTSLSDSPASSQNGVAEISIDVPTTPQEDVEMKVLDDVRGRLAAESNAQVVEENPSCSKEKSGDAMECGEEDSSENSPGVAVESSGTDNDEGIVQDACNISDVDNNNVQSSHKTQPDSDADEQIRLETDSESSNCLRSDIANENCNGQLNLRASI